MKKIINGKRYDTDAAQECGRHSYSNRRDFHYYSETLCKKRTGEFFLYGEGGPASRYARQVEQNSWSGGELITPLTHKEAREWAEEHLTGEEYEAVFGPVEEDATKEVTTFYLRRDLVEKLRREASEKGVTLSALADQKLSV
jgi:hypothetical protein